MKTVNDYLQMVLQTHTQQIYRSYFGTSALVNRTVYNMILISYEQIAYGEY